MVQFSGKHQLRFGSLSHYLQVFSAIPGGFLAGFLKHQQYLVVTLPPIPAQADPAQAM